MGKAFIEFNNKQRMPLVGLGMWQADDPKETEDAVELAIDMGYRHFDTATLYQNEDSLGRALKKGIDSGKVKREELFIVTKLPWHAMAPDRVERFLKKSLERLQLDYIDLYLVHWPIGVKYVSDDVLIPMVDGVFQMDPSTDLEAIWKVLEQQADAGLVKSIGISNFTPAQMDRIMKIARIPPANNQIEVHAYFQQKDWIAACKKHGITVCAYGPLGSPGRTSWNGISYPIPPLFEDPLVKKLAQKYNKTAAQVLLRFLTQLDIAVIPKSVNPTRLKENIDIFDFQLTADELKEMIALDKGEKARSFMSLPGFQDHPECPF